jgi:hypothetical protein
MIIPDPLSRTVKIPIRIVDGKPCLYPDGELPKLKDNVIGDLILPAYALLNKEDADHYTETFKEVCLAKGTTLMAQINPEKVPSKQHWLAVRLNLPGAPGAMVEFVLLKEQQILQRGTKPARLLPCKCNIPSLDQEARSINHAYSLISQAFEPDRISHTGNAFTKVFYFDNRRNIWQPLKALRGY